MDVGGIGGQQNISKALQEAAKGLGETNEIVRNIFKDLEDFKLEMDKQIKNEVKEKIEEQIEKLLNLKNKLSAGNQEMANKIDSVIEDAKNILKGGI